METTMHTLQQVLDITKLKEPFIRRCLKEFEDIFNPHVSRGQNNMILFESSALKIFDNIKQYKEKGYSLPVIKKHLFANYPKHEKPNSNEVLNQIQTLTNENQEKHNKSSIAQENIGFTNGLTAKQLFDMFATFNNQLSQEKDKHYRELSEKEKRISELEKVTETLKETLKLLPEGKTPEQIKAEWEEEQKRKIEEQQKKHEREKLLKELKQTSFLSPFKRANIIKKLEELL